MEATKEVCKARSPAVGTSDKAIQSLYNQANAVFAFSKFWSCLEEAFLVGLCIEVGIAYVTGKYLQVVSVCDDVQEAYASSFDNSGMYW